MWLVYGYYEIHLVGRSYSMRNSNRSPILKRSWIIIALLIIALNFYYLPYYFMKPGEAKVLNTVVNIEGGYEDEGTFMLTTVRMGKANIINYVWAKLSDSRELIHEEDIRRAGESDQEYHQRQLMVMSSSQDNAKIVAYEAAGKEVNFKDLGVIVTGTIEGMAAEEKLNVGDTIVAVNDVQVSDVEGLLAQLESKVTNDNVALTILRENNEEEVLLNITHFPEELDPTQEKVGIGITSPITKRELDVTPAISVNTDQIGGPSAGLMFSLEIYNQLVKEDITKGYQIAGTGTITEEGVVGRIGGIKQKIIAADKAGVDIFFAPNEYGEDNSNYLEALQTAKKINTKMKIIPVDTFEDALSYLEKLE